MNITKRFIQFLIFGSLYYLPLKAQMQYTTQNYVNTLSPVKVSVALLAFENFLLPITAGIMVEGHLKNKLFYNVQFRQGYIRNFFLDKTRLLTTQKESKGTFFEAGMDWVFTEKIKPGKVKVITSYFNDGHHSTQTFFRAECDVRKYWALSGGTVLYNRTKYLNSDSLEYIISGSQNLKPDKDKNMHFNQNTFGLYAGIAHRKIKKAIVSYNGFNARVFYATRFYAHVLIGTTKANDVIYNNVTYKIDNVKQHPLGYRLGWQWDEMGVVTGFEFGKMPHALLATPNPQGINLLNNPFLNYAKLTFQFNIFNGDKKYFKENTTTNK